MIRAHPIFDPVHVPFLPFGIALMQEVFGIPVAGLPSMGGMIYFTALLLAACAYVYLLSCFLALLRSTPTGSAVASRFAAGVRMRTGALSGLGMKRTGKNLVALQRSASTVAFLFFSLALAFRAMVLDQGIDFRA